jgi:hypothetical protein
MAQTADHAKSVMMLQLAEEQTVSGETLEEALT